MNNIRLLLILGSAFALVKCEESVFDVIKGDGNFLEGKRRFEDISSKVPAYGDCWKNAILDLQVGCRHLSEDVQSRLALSFANCFLRNTGSRTCSCSRDQTISECLRNADDRIFSTFREFFTQTQSICYFLQHRAWQEQTEKTISKLASTSEKVSVQLDESRKSQNSIVQLQRIAIKKQHQMINISEASLNKLNHDLENSRKNVKNIFEEFKSTTNEQRMLIFGVFDHIKKLENLVVGEFSGVYTFVYYFITVILTYMLTSTSRTSSARIWLLLLVTCNALLERLIVVYSIEEETTKLTLLDQNGPIYQRIWFCRKVTSILGCAVLTACLYLYKDYSVINNHLLLEIQKQNQDMQHFIKSLSLTPDKYPSFSCSDETSCVMEKKEIFKNGNENFKKINYDGHVAVKLTDKHMSLSPAKTEMKMKPKSCSKKFLETLELDDSYLSDFSSHISEKSSFRRYNLRDRSKLSSPKSFVSTSPDLLSQSIRKAARISLDNKQELKKRLKQFGN